MDIKKRHMGIFIVLFSMILSVFTNHISFAQTIPKATKTFYVADYGKVLSEHTENFIININKNYEKKKEKPQIVLLTVNNMDGLDENNYATKVFEQWKIGNKDYDNGILILLALSERKIKIEVGYGLEGSLPDGKIGAILDQNVKELSQGDYDTALRNIFTSIAVTINEEYGYDHDHIFENYTAELSKAMESTDSPDTFNFFFNGLFPIIAFIIIVFILTKGGGGGYGGGGRGRYRRRRTYTSMGTFGSFGSFGNGGFKGGGGSFGGGGRSGGGGASRGF